MTDETRIQVGVGAERIESFDGFRRILLRAVSRALPNRHSDAADRRSQPVRFLHGQHRRSSPIDHRLHQNSRRPVTQSVEIGGSGRGLQPALLQGTRRTYLLAYLLTYVAHAHRDSPVLHFVSFAELSGSGTKSVGGSEAGAKGSERVVDDGAGGSSPREKRAVCVPRGAGRLLQDSAGDVSGGREVRHHGDRRAEHVVSASGDANSVAVLGDREERVRTARSGRDGGGSR